MLIGDQTFYLKFGRKKQNVKTHAKNCRFERISNRTLWSWGSDSRCQLTPRCPMPLGQWHFNHNVLDLLPEGRWKFCHPGIKSSLTDLWWEFCPFLILFTLFGSHLKIKPLNDLVFFGTTKTHFSIGKRSKAIHLFPFLRFTALLWSWIMAQNL